MMPAPDVPRSSRTQSIATAYKHPIKSGKQHRHPHTWDDEDASEARQLRMD